MTFNPSYKQLFDERGYVIIPDLIPEKWHKPLHPALPKGCSGVGRHIQRGHRHACTVYISTSSIYLSTYVDISVSATGT